MQVARLTKLSQAQVSRKIGMAHYRLVRSGFLVSREAIGIDQQTCRRKHQFGRDCKFHAFPFSCVEFDKKISWHLAPVKSEHCITLPDKQACRY